MTENISESIVKTNEEDWAIFPFDQTSDGRRWVKLIEEIDELASKAEGDTTDCDEILIEDELAQPSRSSEPYYLPAPDVQ